MLTILWGLTLKSSSDQNLIHFSSATLCKCAQMFSSKDSVWLYPPFLGLSCFTCVIADRLAASIQDLTDFSQAPIRYETPACNGTTSRVVPVWSSPAMRAACVAVAAAHLSDNENDKMLSGRVTEPCVLCCSLYSWDGPSAVMKSADYFAMHFALHPGSLTSLKHPTAYITFSIDAAICPPRCGCFAKAV